METFFVFILVLGHGHCLIIDAWKEKTVRMENEDSVSLSNLRGQREVDDQWAAAPLREGPQLSHPTTLS